MPVTDTEAQPQLDQLKSEYDYFSSLEAWQVLKEREPSPENPYNVFFNRATGQLTHSPIPGDTYAVMFFESGTSSDPELNLQHFQENEHWFTEILTLPMDDDERLLEYEPKGPILQTAYESGDLNELIAVIFPPERVPVDWYVGSVQSIYETNTNLDPLSRHAEDIVQKGLSYADEKNRLDNALRDGDPNPSESIFMTRSAPQMILREALLHAAIFFTKSSIHTPLYLDFLKKLGEAAIIANLDNYPELATEVLEKMKKSRA